MLQYNSILAKALLIFFALSSKLHAEPTQNKYSAVLFSADSSAISGTLSAKSGAILVSFKFIEIMHHV
jgi:hypothetical protein